METEGLWKGIDNKTREKEGLNYGSYYGLPVFIYNDHLSPAGNLSVMHIEVNSHLLLSTWPGRKEQGCSLR